MSLVNTAPCNTFAILCISFCCTHYEFDPFAFMNFCSSHAKYFDLLLHSPLTPTSLLHNLRVAWFPQVHSCPRWSLHALVCSFLLCSNIHSLPPSLPSQMYQDYNIHVAFSGSYNFCVWYWTTCWSESVNVLCKIILLFISPCLIPSIFIWWCFSRGLFFFMYFKIVIFGRQHITLHNHARGKIGTIAPPNLSSWQSSAS